jgi:hypothetical protein
MLSALVGSMMLISIAHAEKLCTSDSNLRQYEGLYPQQRVLQVFSKTRVWDKALSATEGPYDAFIIKADGTVTFSAFEHEGNDKGCLEHREGRFWVYDPQDSSKMFGPFVRIGPADDDNAYLSYIFRGCFRDQFGHRWCLGPKSITIGKKQYRLGLPLLDTTEEPTYGTPISVTDDDKFEWVFVPHGKGWEVYREPSYTLEEPQSHGDTPSGKVWRILTPVVSTETQRQLSPSTQQ